MDDATYRSYMASTSPSGAEEEWYFSDSTSAASAKEVPDVADLDHDFAESGMRNESSFLDSEASGEPVSYYFADKTSVVKDLAPGKTPEEKREARRKWAIKILWFLLFVFASLLSLYFFLVAIRWIGDSFILLLGCSARSTFDFASNPLAGLMIGTAVTALLHSSGTVTSLTVALVGANALSIEEAVPLMMGANVGTTVSALLVAFGHYKDNEKFERSMATASVHAFYNICSVLVLYPIELIFHPLEKLSLYLAERHFQTDKYFSSPIDAVVSPLADTLVELDLDLMRKITVGGENCSDDISLIRGGSFFKSELSDQSVGLICLTIGFIVLVLSLVCLINMLARVFMASTQKIVRSVFGYNAYLNIAVGTIVTFCLHSSTVVTCTLTPMAGLGVITLDQAYPLIIGANLGTTGTALLASLVVGSVEAVAVAFSHFFFNLFGILLFYPVPISRVPVIYLAKKLALYSAHWPLLGVMFILFTFVLFPGFGVLLVYLFQLENLGLNALGVILVCLTGLGACALAWWYFRSAGRHKFHMFLRAKGQARGFVVYMEEGKDLDGSNTSVTDSSRSLSRSPLDSVSYP